ncbi:MAG: response regulator transcription factor [Chloroflexi bacterium]|nr:MAG: response regulator transcription factor [Chloroflexota bacterium]
MAGILNTVKDRDQPLVLVVDDDLLIAQLVEKYLQRAGYRVAIAQNGLSALKMIRELSPALVVLDLMLPELDGQAVARAAREENDVSIIMLTALGSTAQRVAGLESGADDYLAKPFAPSELVARVRSVLRRTRSAQTSTIRYGDIVVDPARRLAKLDDQTLELTTSEFDLLHALVHARGRVLTRAFLIDAVIRSEADGIQDRSIDVYVRRLRSKLGDSARDPGHVVTVRGIGYRLAGP